jgi:hypothetical protein
MNGIFFTACHRSTSPPDVAETDRVADDAEEKLHLSRPRSTSRIIAAGRTERADGATLWRTQHDRHLVSIAAGSRVQRRHFVSIVVGIAKHATADNDTRSFRCIGHCIRIACHDLFR